MLTTYLFMFMHRLNGEKFALKMIDKFHVIKTLTTKQL